MYIPSTRHHHIFDALKLLRKNELDGKRSTAIYSLHRIEKNNNHTFLYHLCGLKHSFDIA